MNRVYESARDLIGNTPLVKLPAISRKIPGQIWVKLEYFNPSGSVKDRIALYMLEEAEKRGQVTPGTVIVEPTSGNTGIGLALICALKGYRLITVLPEAVSKERRKLLEYLGAEVEIVPSCACREDGFTYEDIKNTLARAKEIVASLAKAYMPNQFENPDNPRAHADTTALEILAQAGDGFSAFVAACGTGGTFSGVAEVLRRHAPHVRRIAVEPAGSAVMSGCEAGFHKIEGIGEGFVPGTMNMELADEVLRVGDAEAFGMARRLAREEGILAGISGGANVQAALQAGTSLPAGSIIVSLIPDNAFRYFSTDLFRNETPGDRPLENGGGNPQANLNIP